MQRLKYQKPSLVPSSFSSMTLPTHMAKVQSLQTTPLLPIAHLKLSPQLSLNGKLPAEEGNLTAFSGFGLVGFRFSGAARQNQGLMGLFGLSRRTSQEKLNSFEQKLDNLASGYHSWADLILPISRNLPLNDGLWFEVQNSNDTELKEFKIPQNAYRAVLEVYVSFHENDEFWYSNLPNEYIAANNLSGTPGNGPFREFVVSLDGEVVGAVWPFTVIFTGGINPLLWRPITAIGSFDLPTYDIEITPFLGKILDGKSHKFGFNVTNALNVWYIDANLHLWLDKQSTKTEGKLFKHSSLPLVVSLVSDFKGLNGTFLTRTSRSVSSTGWVKSSYGNITTRSIQDFYYSNSMVLGKDGNMQIVNQKIIFNDSVYINLPSSYVHSLTSHKTFPLYLYTDFLGQGNGTYLLITNVDLGFIEKKSGLGFSNSSLRNLQSAEGNMVVKNNLVVSGLGSTQQVYRYDGGKFCYFRNISSSNYTILYDKVGSKCNKKSLSNLDFVLSRLWPFGARMNFAGLRFT
ncbi:PREDICTED: peptide-N4-(N-acetyl-beta-glucosaminyl)asparagine [Prunus dulcis]|uniref:PREDICTED: peptide-N4-(N-acetyl-beta-glucosaminyl)asparagine n=1 Tax=Prunus dulcis TaxID=3755 RepID=A0A5E4GGJ7_PRUDU|nr:PREDICTED: peptide-N4-(N-acetyl-beta-glucosaminyl)asparagine [Prunus dulcis]